MPSAKLTFPKVAASFSPFWFFLLLFKLGAGLHYGLIPVLGAHVLPLPIVGLFIGGSALIQVALDVPAGFALERYGYLPMLQVSTLCFLAAGAVFIPGLTPLTFILSMILSAFGWLFLDPGVSAYLMAHSPSQYTGRLFGLYRTMEAIGITIAVLGLPFFVQFSHSVVGLLIVYPFIGAFAALIIARRQVLPPILAPHLRHRRRVVQSSLNELWQAFRSLHPVSTAFGLYFTLSCGFYGLLWFTLPLLIAADSSHAHVISLGLAMLDASTIIIGFFLGQLADTFSKKVIALLALLSLAIISSLLASTFTPIFIVLCFLFSISNEAFTITLWSWVDSLAPQGTRYGLITGSLTFLADLGWTLGPIIGGLLYVTLGPISSLKWSGLVVGLCALLIGLLLTTAKSPKKLT